MPRKPQPWFRFYVEAIHDRKLRRLTPAQRWLWVVTLAAARQSPVPGDLLVGEGQPMDTADLADLAALKASEVTRGLSEFEAAGMVAHDGDVWRVVNWCHRQYESDNTTERTRKHRSNEQGRNVPTTPVGTPPENREQITDSSSSSVVTHDPPAEPVDDDRIGQAMRTLAERDLERRESEHGRVGDRERWLVAAAQRRLRSHAPRLEALRSAGQLAGLSAAELVDVLERPKVVVGVSTTADGRTFAPGSGYLADWSA